MFYLIIRHLHSGIRWIVLLLLVIAVINSFIKLLKNKKFLQFDKFISAITTRALHVQLTIGLLLYFISPKVIMNIQSMSDRIHRFFLVEHISLMIVSIVIVTIGYVMANKISDDHKKHLRIFLFYLAGLILILYTIPWPWEQLAANWI
jgi:hypothetical protein